jgi:hypothetical protein
MKQFLPLFLLVSAAMAQDQPAWVQKSNRNAQLLIDVEARFSPESASRSGVMGLDDKITVLSADRTAKRRQAIRDAKKELEARLATETDPLVRQDLQILIGTADQEIRLSEANENYVLPYFNAAGAIYSGLTGLLDDQIAPQRRTAALIRLREYTGMEPGFTPITLQAEDRFRDKLKVPGLSGNSRLSVEKNLENTNAFLTGIALLFEKYKIPGYQEAYAKLKEQLLAYDEFVRKEVLPKTRADFRLPPALYTIALEQYGVDFSQAELTRRAHDTFAEIQAEMKPVAAKIAKEHNLPSSDYRDVVRFLKKDQIPGDKVLPVYQKRLAEIEDIIRREHLVTLPQRPAIIRIASAAETAEQPAPHMVPPPLMNNQGERGQFVLPLETTGQGGKTLKYDDFNFDAASWTLIAHEARPGHELQFDAMVERGVSLARALFAFNSTNVEGWGLYSEWYTLPYMPDDGKLISLQLRLLRAARAFLDPELQQGKVTPAQAMEVLQKDVVLSEGFATEEVERFTFRMPGQAVSYFDGYTRLREIRADVEKALGPKLNVQRFHDYILSQGLLPPDLLRKAVMEEFVPQEKARR